MLLLIKQYTKDEIIVENVFRKLSNVRIDPGDPFCEYNILLLVLLEELKVLRSEQLYSKMIEAYKKDLHKTIATMNRGIQQMFSFLLGSAFIIVVIAFTIGFILGKMRL